MRRPSAIVAAVTVLLAIGTAVASALPHDAELGRLAAVGPVTLSSSQPGVAILHADSLRPGDKVAGILSLTNKGDKPGVLALGVTGRRDRPGAYGGRLGNVLRLKVEDLSGRTPARESVVNQASTFALGTLVGRETRNYRVTATFPDGGIPPTPFTGDNALQGSSVELALQWNLTAADPVPTRPPVAPPAKPGPARRADAAARRRQAPAAADPARAEAARAQAARPQGVRQVPDRVQGALHRAHRQRAGQEEGQEAQEAQDAPEEEAAQGRAQVAQAARRQASSGSSSRCGRRRAGSSSAACTRHGRVGITIIAHMRSAAGTRTAKRRIVMRTYKKTDRRR